MDVAEIKKAIEANKETLYGVNSESETEESVATLGPIARNADNTVCFNVDDIPDGVYDLTVYGSESPEGRLSTPSGILHSGIVVRIENGKMTFVSISAEDLNAPAVNQPDIKVTVGGKEVVFLDQQPVIVNGSTLVPVRGVFEEMGFDVSYDETTATAALTKEGAVVTIKRGDSFFTVSGQEKTPTVPPQIKNGRFMLPLRAIAEAIGAIVEWDSGSRTVLITMP